MKQLLQSYLESFLTARHSSKDVIGIHCSKDEVPSSPWLEAVPADDSVASPTLQTGHANSCHVAGLSLAFDLQECNPLIMNEALGLEGFLMGREPTLMQEFECCRGLKKKVPSMRGYRSKMYMMFLQSTQGTLFILLLA